MTLLISFVFLVCNRYFHWTYVTVVYSDSEYGVHCYETLRDLAVNDTICFTAPHRVIRFQFAKSDYMQIMSTISNKTDLRGTNYTRYV